MCTKSFHLEGIFQIFLSEGAHPPQTPPFEDCIQVSGKIQNYWKKEMNKKYIYSSWGGRNPSPQFFRTHPPSPGKNWAVPPLATNLCYAPAFMIRWAGTSAITEEVFPEAVLAVVKVSQTSHVQLGVVTIINHLDWENGLEVYNKAN